MKPKFKKGMKPKFKKGDMVWVKAEVWETLTEKGTCTVADGFYEVLLPEGLEYRFPEASVPMGILHESNLKK